MSNLPSSNGQVVWLTGLSAAGKTTIAKALEEKLITAQLPVNRVDGDDIRSTVCRDLGFSAEDRTENVRRVAKIAAALADAGQVCIVALISPLRAHREAARAIVGAGRFIEVYVATPLAVCRQRDPKGLYRRADRGEISEFTGVSAPYEAPLAADLVLHTEADSLETCAQEVFRFLRSR